MREHEAWIHNIWKTLWQPRLHNIIINIYLSVAELVFSLFLSFLFASLFTFLGLTLFFALSLSLVRSMFAFGPISGPYLPSILLHRYSTKQIQIQTHKRMINELLFSLRSHFILLTLCTDAKVLVSSVFVVVVVVAVLPFVSVACSIARSLELLCCISECVCRITISFF